MLRCSDREVSPRDAEEETRVILAGVRREEAKCPRSVGVSGR